MKENKASTFVFYFSLVLSAVLIIHMVFDQPIAVHAPQTPVQQVSTIYAEDIEELPYDATELQHILQTTWMPQDALTVQVGNNGQVYIQVEMQRDHLIERFSLPTLTEKLLPEQCAVAMTCSIGLRTNPQQLVVEPLGLTVNGVELSPSVLEPLTDTLTTVLSTNYSEKGK